MDNIYQYQEYRRFILARWKAAPKRGYGQARRLAEHLGCHTTLVSQVLKGSKSFTPEQAASAAEFLGLNENETEYFLLLVNLDRAGSELLKRSLRKRIQQIQSHSAELVNRLSKNQTLSEDQKAVFYSDWTYTAIRQGTAIPGNQDPDSIARYLDLPRKHVSKVLDFLVSMGLCKWEGSKVVVGPSYTHLESSSPWVQTHHRNWRLQAMSSMHREYPSKLHYSAPMTLSAADSLRVREEIAKLLERIDGVLDSSNSEELHCLNIDWFRVKGG